MAIRAGLARATGEVVVIQDADLEYNPAELPAVLEPIWQGKATVSYGSRFLGRVEDMRLPNYCGNMVLAWLVRVLFRSRVTDEATAYKAFRRDAVEGLNLTCERFEFCPEITARLLRRGHKIVETPVSFKARDFHEGKKIGWRDFFIAVRVLFYYRFIEK
jgi:dolichol-phosphate mannosyltransferase